MGHEPPSSTRRDPSTNLTVPLATLLQGNFFQHVRLIYGGYMRVRRGLYKDSFGVHIGPILGAFCGRLLGLYGDLHWP